MKGKIIYTVVVEKEIEIPEEIITIAEKSWRDRTEEEDKILERFSIETWKSVENFDDTIGIYYTVEGTNYVIEEY